MLHTEQTVEIGRLLFLYFPSWEVAALRRFQVSQVTVLQRKNREKKNREERLKKPDESSFTLPKFSYLHN